MKFSVIICVFHLFGFFLVHSQTIIPVHADQADTLQAMAGDDVDMYPGESVLLGASASASGGTEPYTYSWKVVDNAISTESNPAVNPEETTVYTLLVTDNNSCASTDEITVSIIPVGINDFSKEEISIYPNPARDMFTVEYQGEEAEMMLLDELGNLLWRKRIHETETFPTPNTPGTYLLKISAPGKESVKKISVCK